MMWCPKCKGWEDIPTENGWIKCALCENGTITADQLEPDTIPCPKCETQGIVWKENGSDYWAEYCDRCNGELYIKVNQMYWIRRTIEDYFLFTEPWRRMLLHLCDYLPKPMSKRLVNRLYPDDMGIGF